MPIFSTTDEVSAVVEQPDLSLQLQQQIAAAETRAQAECLSFSNLMYKKLPRELRDLLYNFLCLDDRQIPIGPYYHYRKYEPRGGSNNATYSNTQYFPRSGELETELSDGKTRIDHDIYPQDDLLLPHNHIFDVRYVGAEVAAEALKKYYQSNRFSVCNVEGGLDDLCTAVKWGAGSITDFVPIDYIRDLQIRVKSEHMYTASKGCVRTREVALREFAKQEPVLRSTIESLQRFQSRMQTAPPHELDLEIVLMSEFNQDEFTRPWRMNLLQTVRNMIYELLHDRDNTTVRVTHQDESLSAFPTNCTGFFKLTKEQWHFEKSKQRTSQDWSQHFWIIPVKAKHFSASDILEFGGYCLDDISGLMSKRWGVEDMLRGTTSFLPIVECPYWPIGKPYNSQAVQAYLNKAEQTTSGGANEE